MFTTGGSLDDLKRRGGLGCKRGLNGRSLWFAGALLGWSEEFGRSQREFSLDTKHSDRVWTLLGQFRRVRSILAGERST
jgi:hypothetical protein